MPAAAACQRAAPRAARRALHLLQPARPAQGLTTSSSSMPYSKHSTSNSSSAARRRGVGGLSAARRQRRLLRPPPGATTHCRCARAPGTGDRGSRPPLASWSAAAGCWGLLAVIWAAPTTDPGGLACGCRRHGTMGSRSEARAQQAQLGTGAHCGSPRPCCCRCLRTGPQGRRRCTSRAASCAPASHPSRLRPTRAGCATHLGCRWLGLCWGCSKQLKPALTRL